MGVATFPLWLNICFEKLIFCHFGASTPNPFLGGKGTNLGRAHPPSENFLNPPMELHFQNNGNIDVLNVKSYDLHVHVHV